VDRFAEAELPTVRPASGRGPGAERYTSGCRAKMVHVKMVCLPDSAIVLTTSPARHGDCIRTAANQLMKSSGAASNRSRQSVEQK